jgi:hypothetical protein
MKHCFACLAAACAILSATEVFGQAFFDVRILSAAPVDFNAANEGDYLVGDYGSHSIDDSTVSRFKVDAFGGIGSLTIALDETFVGIGAGAFVQTAPLFPQFRIADNRLSVELYGAVVPHNAYFEIVHSTPFAIRANLLGDATHDGGLSAVDIDATNRAIAAGGADPTFDLNFDGRVDPGDTRHLVEALIGTRFGDLNLDRAVNRLDAAQLARNYGATTGVGWAGGDLDGAGGVNLRDLLEVGRNLGFVGNSPAAAAPQAAVPEPAALELLTLALLACGGAYRRRRKT